MEISSFDGTKINYVDTGEGKVTLIIIHGMGAKAELWKKQIERFSQSFRVVALDLGGHGSSGKIRDKWTMESFGRDVNAVAEALDISNAILIGHSMGGAVALEAARVLGDRIIGIIGIDTLFPALYFELPAEQITGYLAPLKVDLEAGLRELYGPFVGGLGEEEKRMAITPYMEKDALLETFENLLQWDLRPIIPDITVPVKCILAGVTRDAIITTPEKAWFEDQFETTYMENVAHWLFLEKPDEFSEVLLEVIQSLT
ncbi:MAG: alpha/beta fold hydrolase [Candidatus Thorarchaeota archaeon]|jgi:pimeloyl-ACP methyl ester carboxylesterase